MLNEDYLYTIGKSEIQFELEVKDRKVTPERLAYLIVSKFYQNFGIEYEFIPFTKTENEQVIIDPEMIKKIK